MTEPSNPFHSDSPENINVERQLAQQTAHLKEIERLLSKIVWAYITLPVIIFFATIVIASVLSFFALWPSVTITR